MKLGPRVCREVDALQMQAPVQVQVQVQVQIQMLVQMQKVV